MKFYSLVCLLFFSSLSFAQTEIEGVEFPNTIQIENKEANFSGAGIRKKLWVKAYAIGFYHNESTTNADKIIRSKKPMGIKIQILSRFVSNTKFEAAAREGFEKSASNTASIKTKIEYFLSLLDEHFTFGDVCKILYHPDTGVKVYKNGKLKGIVKGAEFKKALYSIWLGDQPVEKELKENLLGVGSLYAKN